MDFVHKNIPETDIITFFQPTEEERGDIQLLDDGWIMAHIMTKIGMFPSVGQARKNGWDTPIPKGWTDMIVGKKRIRVCILNEFD